jgi:alkanesulfonate monooxygenase SsuD/methylene tetrahydromethanopterin reductase-like flavin-dependent oxidoreductase (luciferase family)
MQFALFSHVPWPEGVDPYRIVSDTTEQVQYGEELGFHGAWFAEHHFSRYGCAPQRPRQFGGVGLPSCTNTPVCATRRREMRSARKPPHQAGRAGR